MTQVNSLPQFAVDLITFWQMAENCDVHYEIMKLLTSSGIK